MPAYGTRADLLGGLARRLGAEEVPYYLHNPRAPSEPAPGWYWRPAGATHPQYLAHGYLAAHYALTRLYEIATEDVTP
jgi:hypothetical protein